MKRLVIKAILTMCGKVLLGTLVAGAIIGVIDYKYQWDTSMAYSNAFFFAGYNHQSPIKNPLAPLASWREMFTRSQRAIISSQPTGIRPGRSPRGGRLPGLKCVRAAFPDLITHRFNPTEINPGRLLTIAIIRCIVGIIGQIQSY